MTFLAFLWQYKFYIASFIIGGMLFGGGAWKIQGMRLDSCKKNEAVCLTANAENAKTITAQKAEIKKATESCSARINSKDKAIRKLKEIDNLKPGEVSNATDNNTVGSNSGDSILDALAGMFKSDSKD
jgi:hypothetical protein